MTGSDKKPAPAWKRILLIAAGIASVAIGTLGIFIPLLPTTPFLLLAAACFIRSSERFYLRLIRHRYLGTYIRNYREKGGITRRHKITTLALLWITILISAFVFIPLAWLRPVPVLIAIGVTRHILRIPTVE
ncbi:MAG TPA: DUF454 domain-containing protein [bacterium]|nr:DUF454 domain-containing protein [bacterium]